MALVPDYNPDEEESAADRVGAGPRASSMVGGAAPSSSVSPSSQTRSPMSGGGEFTPWSSFVSANREVSQREAGKLKSGVQSQVNSAITGRESASAAQAAGVADNYNIKNDEGGASVSAFGGTSFGGNEPAKAPAQGASTFTRELKDTQADGAANLEEQVGAPAWSALIGQTANAQAQAKSLGSEGGVQALLGKTAGPASAFDAALVGGAGGKDFRDLSKQYGGTQLTDNLLSANQSAVDRWQGLLGDIDKAKTAQGVAATEGGAAAQRQTVEPSPYATSPAGAVDWLERAMAGGYGNAMDDLQTFSKWANAIYGPGADLNKLKADMGRMTWEEFQAFKNGTVPAWMGLGTGATGFHGLGMTQAEAAVRQVKEQAKKALASYSFGGTGSVNSLGNKGQFLAALASGQKYGDGGNWGGGNDPSVAQQAESAAETLGISTEALTSAIQRMTDSEYQDFWLLGVIPEWLSGVQGYESGVVGGWQSPFLQGVMKFGNDGGMWNAVTNMWKDSAIKSLGAAVSGPAGIVGLGATTALGATGAKL